MSITKIGCVNHDCDKCKSTTSEQEPVALDTVLRKAIVRSGKVIDPPQYQWVGLTWYDMPNEWVGNIPFMEGAKWAEAKLKEKNT